MIDDALDRRLMAAIEDGLPLVSRPYAAVASSLGMSEASVIDRLAALASSGVIRRLGLIVRHRELGYEANAMAVWDVPDELVDGLGGRVASHSFLTLCYRRPRRPRTGCGPAAPAAARGPATRPAPRRSCL